MTRPGIYLHLPVTKQMLYHWATVPFINYVEYLVINQQDSSNPSHIYKWTGYTWQSFHHFTTLIAFLHKLSLWKEFYSKTKEFAMKEQRNSKVSKFFSFNAASFRKEAETILK